MVGICRTRVTERSSPGAVKVPVVNPLAERAPTKYREPWRHPLKRPRPEVPGTSVAPVPALLGRYRPVSVIGHGGMATVYRAVDESLGREVAIKVFRTGAAIDLERHQLETRVLAALNHHGLVTLLDAGIDDSEPSELHPFLVMELVEGENLEDRLARGPLTAREISEVAYDIAEALEFVHANGVVHRDIKPSNIMLVEYGTSAFRVRARLTDFGIALIADNPQLEANDVTTGTAAYLSPEQAQRQEATPASDVYALGLVLLQCFTGQLAFPGEVIESALARLARDPEIPADLPDDWDAILHGMLAREPMARPPIAELTIAFRQAVIATSSRHKADAEEALRNAEQEQRDEARRDAARRHDLLDPPADDAFDRITALVTRSLPVPIAIVTLVDDDRVWYSTRRGTQIDGDPRALLEKEQAQAAGLQFFAEVALTASDGQRLGTMSVLDVDPRELSSDEGSILLDLAAIIVDELELRIESRRLADALDPDAELDGLL